MGSGSGTGGSGLMGGADGVDENGNRDGDGEDDDGLDISISTMKRYISYCRTRCAPTLSEEATLMLRSHYVSVRTPHEGRSARARARPHDTSSSFTPATPCGAARINMHAEHMARNAAVPLFVSDIAHNEDKIKTRQNCGQKVNVFRS